VARAPVPDRKCSRQIVLKGGDFGVPARHLQRHRDDGGRQQAFETEGAALRLGESGAFVEAGADCAANRSRWDVPTSVRPP